MKMFVIVSGWTLALVLICLPVAGQAETLTFTPTDDMYTDPDHPGTHPQGELWTADWSPQNNYQRINIAFYLSDLDGLGIESATLNLYRFFGCPAGDPTNTRIHHITMDWDETTWPTNVHCPNGDDIWTNYVFSANGWHAIDVTDLVQAWADGTLDNHGLVIIAVASKYTKCYSKESANPAQHPYLEVITQESAVKESATMPSEFDLSVYPNPFNAATTIHFSLAQSQHTRLSIYNVLGVEIVELFEGSLGPGNHQFNFDPLGLASGVYFLRLITDDHKQTERILLQR